MVFASWFSISLLIACVVLDGSRGPGKCAAALVAFGVLLAAGK